MTAPVTLPLWLFLLILAFAGVTFASHFLFPSVRWFFRRRLERAVARLNERLERPIRPFKLAERHDTIQRLIYDPEVSRAIVATAEAEGVPENVAFERARRYAREIVPAFSASLYFGLAIRLARWLSGRLYAVRLEQAEVVARIDRDATVVFVMNHRSNMDYVLLTHLVAETSPLAYAVGEWARVWPVSRLIRALGGYFIRRREGNMLYRRVLARYVQLATEGGVTQALYPEGGLSLTGGLGPPKLGLLKYIAEAETAGRDVIFVPVGLNYDRVLEDRLLTSAGQAGTRRFRARPLAIARFVFGQLWFKITGRHRRFGQAAVRFGRPLSLADFRGAHDADPRALAEALMRRIGAAVPVVPVPVVAHLLRSDGAMPRAALHRRAAALTEGLGVPALTPAALDQAVGQLAARKIVVEQGDTLAPAEDETVLLDFYARSIAHLLPPDAAAAE
ncbi:1-acyl-sn-glycerol-3-phosphate acyltransferase [Rhodosalinus sp. K401]|uniref:1-acyl-sn-glycerol-3-phosphate acyltransferase n=1 Tax=Rhodosalinus sp. K401 TaxID=3239195 RepID=UPI0035265C7D